MEFGVFLTSLFVAMSAPFLLSLISANMKVMLLTLGCSLLTVLLSTEDYWSAVPWTIGMLVAVMAIYHRFAESAQPTQPQPNSQPAVVMVRARRRTEVMVAERVATREVAALVKLVQAERPRRTVPDTEPIVTPL